MVTPSREDIDIRLYRAALHLSPAAFRREFGAQMLRDFAEARGDADLIGGPAGIWRFRARLSVDLARTLVAQWWRTGMPVVAALAVSATFVAISSLDRVWRHMQVRLPATTADVEGLVTLMIATVVVLFIILTVLLTQWATQPRLRRHLRTPRR